MTYISAYSFRYSFAEALRRIVRLAVRVGVTVGGSLEICLTLANSWKLRRDCPTTSSTRPGSEIDSGSRSFGRVRMSVSRPKEANP